MFYSGMYRYSSLVGAFFAKPVLVWALGSEHRSMSASLAGNELATGMVWSNK